MGIQLHFANGLPPGRHVGQAQHGLEAAVLQTQVAHSSSSRKPPALEVVPATITALVWQSLDFPAFFKRFGDSS